MVVGHEIWHVAVAPPSSLDDGLVSKVVSIVGKSPYETRLRLTGKIPKIIANFDNLPRAESATRNLSELGLRVITVSDSRLRKPAEIFKARSLRFDGLAVTFLDRSGQSKTLQAADLFLILSVKMHTVTETQSIKITRKINIAATILTGGIPIPKKVKEKITNTSYQTESFIRLYDGTSPEFAVQISQAAFDYSFLGSEMSSSAAANFVIAVKKIREALPQVIFDDSLIDPFGANVPATMALESMEANCKLVYWYHKAAKS